MVRLCNEKFVPSRHTTSFQGLKNVYTTSYRRLIDIDTRSWGKFRVTFGSVIFTELRGLLAKTCAEAMCDICSEQAVVVA